jgi:O-antigen/teichoic acid export membrane protein
MAVQPFPPMATPNSTASESAPGILTLPQPHTCVTTVWSGSTSHAAFALADQLVVSATSFVASLIVARTCAKEQFGIYSLGLTVVTVLVGIQQALILSPYTMLRNRRQGCEEQTYTGSILIHYGLLTVASWLLVSITATAVWLSRTSAGLAPAIWALGVAITFMLLRDFQRRLSFAKLRFERALIVDLVIAMLQTAVLVLFAKYWSLSPARAFAAIGFASAVPAAAWYIFHREYFSFVPQEARSDAALNWTAGRWVFGSYLVVLGSSQLYPWLIFLFHGAAAVGMFAAAWTAVAIIQTLLMGLGNYAGPTLAAAHPRGLQHLRRFVFKISAVVVIVLIVLNVGILIVGERLITLLFGAKYAGTGMLVFLLALGISATALSTGPACALWSIGREDINCKVGALGLGIALILGIVLVRAYGALGAALAAVIANSLVSAGKCMGYTKVIANLARRDA